MLKESEPSGGIAGSASESCSDGERFFDVEMSLWGVIIFEEEVADDVERVLLRVDAMFWYSGGLPRRSFFIEEGIAKGGEDIEGCDGMEAVGEGSTYVKEQVDLGRSVDREHGVV